MVCIVEGICQIHLSYSIYETKLFIYPLILFLIPVEHVPSLTPDIGSLVYFFLY